jgi:hypothetical protein
MHATATVLRNYNSHSGLACNPTFPLNILDP